MIQGISHITFIVRDLDKMSKFLTTIFDAQEVYASGDKIFSIAKEKFFLINGLWIAIMEGESLVEKTYNHVAFKISAEDYEIYAARVKSLGVDVKEDRKRVEGEGRSLYFYDYDNHLFELHTGTLNQRLQKYLTTQ
ncbi:MULTISPECIES: FosX/FosE/FosI family fosfomycin resistance hydrolase [unclassified Tolypothrix]|uniref:FosX/FosE/FosI family fosfomycin resistance hydrolase n=1 Tax=unclassified Tolypothrix TaxID=2649714 RepID=UPI0005F8968D|nr:MULTISPECIES: FosX/FosE/FosI family fosfomycin resistance hydrolase [unclassified Tolypothrix]MBE9085184.1 FosX/FosE/FosI family fosfomycin resistance thiol transferase [Tolypothrix sp. LEGE 11397]UYD24183.1 FosX/FosE/FosI family fosfomycin resistance thiol transferase [Tolypothrix sp. PCC 7712]UYD33588.1 FosX/FosE/FosI family fosfomycin resistance thiol transferase [Tolypothrix sp. PCC 7601]BAY89951.1 phosphonate metabolism protein PhnM [Microchaete diplosiphon NIES-3275]